MKQCTGCGQPKDESRYGTTKYGSLQAQCRDCYANKSRVWYAANKERASLYGKTKYAANKQEYAAYAKKWQAEHAAQQTAAGRRRYAADPERWVEHNLRRKFGISLAEYTQMSVEQNGLCAICGGENADGHRLSVDHDHFTGELRRLVCGACNHVIGHAKESPTILRISADYLEAHDV